MAGELNRGGVPSPRHGLWTATALRRLLARIEAALSSLLGADFLTGRWISAETGSPSHKPLQFLTSVAC